MISISSPSMNPRHNLDHGHFDPAANDNHYQSFSHNNVVSTPLSVSAELANKRKRKPAGTPDPDAEVIALSPKALMESDRYVCEICGQGFQREQNLQMHRRRHKVPWKLLKREGATDVRKRVYVCPEPSCLHHNSSHALGDLVGIKKHYRRKHSSLKQWKCHKCSKAYAVQSDYKAHLKTCGTRGHCCDCGRVFSRVESFIEHQDTCSNGEKANTHKSPHRQGSDITDCTATTYSPTITSTRSSAAQHHDGQKNNHGQELLMMKPAISSPVINGNQNPLSIDLSGQLLSPQREELQLLPGPASTPSFMPNSSIHNVHKHGDDDGDENDDYNDNRKMAISGTSPSNMASNHQHLHLSIGLNNHHNVSSAGAPKLTKAEEDLSTQCSSSHDLSRGLVFSNHYLQPSSLTGEEWQSDKSIDGHQQRDNQFMDAKLPTENLHFQRKHTKILSSTSKLSFNNPENREDNGDVEDNRKRQLVGNPNHHHYHEKKTLVQLVNHDHEHSPLIERLLNAERALQEAKHQRILVEKELILANTGSIEKQVINHQYHHHEQERPLAINISSLTSTTASSSSSTSATTSFSNLNPHQQQIVLLHITCPSCNHIINIDIYPHGD